MAGPWGLGKTSGPSMHLEFSVWSGKRESTRQINGARWSHSVVTAGGSVWAVLFNAGGRRDRKRMTPGPGQVHSSGGGLSTQHTSSEPLVCSGPSAYAWGTEKNNSQAPARHIVIIESDEQFK